MILNVDFKDEQEVIEVRAAMRSIVRKAVFNTLVYEGFKKDVEVSVTFVDNEGIKVLNNQYRQKNCATDVLSFPIFDDFAEIDMYPEPVPLGDIVISLERAEQQGHHLFHSIYHEVAFLSVHSTLHLLGYDHVDEGEMKAQMRKREKAIMGDKEND